MGDAHDRRHDLDAHRQLLECLRLVGRAPDVGVGGIRLLGGIPIRQLVLGEERTHLGTPSELGHELVVEPRLVDPQPRVDEQPVAIETLDVVAFVGAAVAPHVDPVVVHRLHEQRPGDGAPEWRRVEVRAARGGDVERAALEGDQALVHQLLAAIDEAGLLGAVLACPLGHRVELRLVVLAEIGRVGERDRALVAHPGHRRRRVETAGEGDADPLSDGQRAEDVSGGRFHSPETTGAGGRR